MATKRQPTFTDKAAAKRASAKAKGVKRPNRKGKVTLINEAKKEIIKEELIRQGYLQEVEKNMPKVMRAHFKVAGMAKVGATQERKLMFEAAGIKKAKDDVDPTALTIGQVLAELAKGRKPA